MTRTFLHIVCQASLALVAASVFDDNALLQVVNTSATGEKARTSLEMYHERVKAGTARYIVVKQEAGIPQAYWDALIHHGCINTCDLSSHGSFSDAHDCFVIQDPANTDVCPISALVNLCLEYEDESICLTYTDEEIGLIDDFTPEDHITREKEDNYTSTDSPFRSVGTGLENLDWSDGLRDGNYDMPTNAGQNVNVYVADTGVNCWHADFRSPNRCIKVFDYFDNVRAPTPNSRCLARSRRCGADKQGHGTHCAGTVAGEVHGQAGSATIGAVKVLSDSGSGYTTGIILGIEQAVQHCTGGSSSGQYNCVISMSLGGSGVTQSYEVAIGNALSRGVVTTVAAGNSNADACNFSPAFAPSAITVGSCQDSGPSSTTVAMSSFSNYGSCVDIFGIGSSVKSADNRYKTSARTMSGTSMSCPGVAGAVAIYHAWYQNLNGNQIRTHAVDAHISGMITGLPSGTNTPNKFMCIWKGKKNNRCGR